MIAAILRRQNAIVTIAVGIAVAIMILAMMRTSQGYRRLIVLEKIFVHGKVNHDSPVAE